VSLLDDANCKKFIHKKYLKFRAQALEGTPGFEEVKPEDEGAAVALLLKFKTKEEELKELIKLVCKYKEVEYAKATVKIYLENRYLGHRGNQHLI